jgi:hypothetical protein
VTATFTGSHTLTVSRAGSGTGTVTSAPVGIDCGTTCGATLANGTLMTLTAAPAAGSTFSGWSGCDQANGLTCTVTMSAVKSVTAAFERVNAGVRVERASGLPPSSEPTLQATLTARAGCGSIERIQFGEMGRSFDNARVTITAPAGGQSGQTTGFTYTPSTATTSVSLTIQRVIQSGGATVNPVRLHDGCGEWRTLVGGGPSAFAVP